MLVCNKCGKLRESSELGYAIESHGERHLDTNCSCGGEFVPAKRCSLCGKWFDGTDLHGVCEVCLGEEETVGNAIEIGSYSKVTKEINGFFAEILTDEMIEKILGKWVEENFVDHSKAVVDYLESDVSAFAEFLEDKYKE
jgi:predicted amidophosphoribosyltransferase